jgi:hypothetical protein
MPESETGPETRADVQPGDTPHVSPGVKLSDTPGEFPHDSPGTTPPGPAVGREGGGDGPPPPSPGTLTVDHVMRVVGEVLFGLPPPHSLEHAALEVERRLKEREGGA